MSRQPERWYFLLSRAATEEYPISGILDMLRYTGAAVESNGPQTFWMLSAPHWSKTYEDRFKSFGIKIHGPWPATLRNSPPYELIKYAESYRSER